VIKKYAYKNNNLILLFSLIDEITHLSGNVKNVNSLFDLFLEYSLPQQNCSFREYKKKFKLYIVCYFQRQSCNKYTPYNSFFGR